MTSNITSNHNTMDSLKITPWCSLDTLHGFTTFTVLWNIWNMKGKVIVNFTFTAWIKKAMWAQPGRGPIREKQERDALQSWKEAIFWQVVILHTSLCTALHCLLHCVQTALSSALHSNLSINCPRCFGPHHLTLRGSMDDFKVFFGPFSNFKLLDQFWAY